MNSAAEDFGLVRFSTKHLPEDKGLLLWREFCTRRIAPVEIEAETGTPLDAEVALLAWPGLQAMWCKISAQMRFIRTDGMVAGGHNSFVFIINQGGELAVSQRGVIVSLEMGEAIAALCSEPGRMTVTNGEFSCLIVSRAVLARLVSEVGQVAMQIIRRDSEPLRLLSRNPPCF